MSTLTALKLQRELQLTRLAMAAGTARPKLVCRWVVDQETGRPVAVWMQERDSPVVMADATFA